MSSFNHLGWLTGRKDDDLPYHTQDEEKPTSTMHSIQGTLSKMPDMSSLSKLAWPINRKEPGIPFHTAQPPQDQEKPTPRIISLQKTLGNMPSMSSLSESSWVRCRKGATLPYYMPQKPIEPFPASPYDQSPDPIFTSTHAKEKWDEENQRRLFQMRKMRNRLEEYWWRFYNTINFCSKRVAVGGDDSLMSRLTNDPSKRALLVTFALSLSMCILILAIFRTRILEWLRR